MENKSEHSIRELTEIIRDCQSMEEMEKFITYLQIDFDNYPLSDQSFLLALIGVTLMTITADKGNDHVQAMRLPQLLSEINWSGKKVADT